MLNGIALYLTTFGSMTFTGWLLPSGATSTFNPPVP